MTYAQDRLESSSKRALSPRHATPKLRPKSVGARPSPEIAPQHVATQCAGDYSNPGDLLALQHTVGNRAVIQLVSRRTDRPESMGASAGDRYDKQRRRVAAQEKAEPGSAARATSQTASKGPVLQLKAVSSNRLNVVGEDHAESNKRRYAEEQIAKEDAAGGYWTEGEFMVGEDTRDLLSWMFTSDPRRRGDSPILLAEMNAAALVRLCRIWRARIENWNSESEEDKKKVKGAMPGLFRFITDVAVHNGRAESGAQSPELVEATNAVARIVYAVAKGTKVDTYAGFPSAIDKLDKLIRLRTPRQIGEERSHYMDQSARMSAGTKGIWKIGQNHIDDLRVPGAAPTPNYEILTRVEFNAQYRTRLLND